MKDDYNPIELEEAIQSLWNKEKTFETKFKNTNNKYYIFCVSLLASFCFKILILGQ